MIIDTIMNKYVITATTEISMITKLPYYVVIDQIKLYYLMEKPVILLRMWYVSHYHCQLNPKAKSDLNKNRHAN